MAEGEMRSPEVVEAHCNHCGGSRRSFVRAEHETSESQDIITSWNTYRIVECCGCGNVCVQHEYSMSEDGDHEQDPATGDWHWVPNITTTYHPPAQFRPLPRWFDELADATLARVMREVCAALQNDSLILATAGSRILLDRAMVLLLKEDVGGFDAKLKELVARGMIAPDERDLLDIMTDAGNAASHRGHSPTRQDLETILDTIEQLLQRKFILPKAADHVRKATPQRPGCKPKGGEAGSAAASAGMGTDA